MRIFIGTMYCGEGDYAECCSAIAKQEGGHEIEHVTIANLPEHHAHNMLWNEWRKRQAAYDLFVKIDADTVLRDTLTIDNICRCFEENPRLTGLQAPLHDYFTDSNINGLNCFSPRVVFRDTTDPLYCDRVDVGHDLVYREHELLAELIPAGYHCHRATDMQAFHFGLHRALKKQHKLIETVRTVWSRTKDRSRAFVLYGALAAEKFAQTQAFNYTDAQLRLEFEAARTYYEKWQAI